MSFIIDYDDNSICQYLPALPSIVAKNRAWDESFVFAICEPIERVH